MNIRAGLVAGLLAMSGCTTTNLGSVATPPGLVAAAVEPAPRNAANGQITATIIGAMGGGLIGRGIGSDLDEGERRIALEAEYRALEYTPGGQPVFWKSTTSARYGEAVASQPYRVGSQDCRQYTQTVFASGPAQIARGTACRNADGSWTPLT